MPNSSSFHESEQYLSHLAQLSFDNTAIQNEEHKLILRYLSKLALHLVGQNLKSKILFYQYLLLPEVQTILQSSGPALANFPSENINNQLEMLLQSWKKDWADNDRTLPIGYALLSALCVGAILASIILPASGPIAFCVTVLLSAALLCTIPVTITVLIHKKEVRALSPNYHDLLSKAKDDAPSQLPIMDRVTNTLKTWKKTWEVTQISTKISAFFHKESTIEKGFTDEKPLGHFP